MLFRSMLAILVLLWAIPGMAQVNGGVPPYTFSPGRVIQSAEVNANFVEIFDKAIARTGGTFSGTVAIQNSAPQLDFVDTNGAKFLLVNDGGLLHLYHTSTATNNLVWFIDTASAMVFRGQAVFEHPFPVIIRPPDAPAILDMYDGQAPADQGKWRWFAGGGDSMALYAVSDNYQQNTLVWLIKRTAMNIGLMWIRANTHITTTFSAPYVPATSTPAGHLTLSNDGNIAMVFGLQDAGAASYPGWVQVANIADAVAYPLKLNPSGGSVHIGQGVTVDQNGRTSVRGLASRGTQQETLLTAGPHVVFVTAGTTRLAVNAPQGDVTLNGLSGWVEGQFLIIDNTSTGSTITLVNNAAPSNNHFAGTGAQSLLLAGSRNLLYHTGNGWVRVSSAF